MKQLVTAMLVAGAGLCTMQAQTVTTITTSAIKIDDDLIFDKEGNLYGSNYVGASVYKRTPDGQESIFTSGVGSPNGMAFMNDSTIILADNTGNKLFKVHLDGSKEVLINSIDGPSGMLRMWNSDTILVTSYIVHEIWKLAPDGTLHDFLSHPQFNGPVGLCYDPDGNLYVANFTDRKIFKVTPDGQISFLAQPPLGQNIGFLAYAHGYLYATAFNAHKIYRIDLEGNYHVWLGSNLGSVDGDASVAKFNRPNGIRASITGDTLYVSDFGSKRVRMITNLDGTSATKNMDSPVRGLSISPNPVRQKAWIDLELSTQTYIRMSLYDNNGMLVQRILPGQNVAAGHHRLEFSGEALSTGFYFLHLQTEDGQNVVRKVVLE